MTLDIRGHLKPTAAIKEYVERRIGFALGRFSSRVKTVTVRLDDANGPRGGADKTCQIAVALAAPRGEVPVVVEEVHGDLYAAISLAATRVGRVVGREIERARYGRPRSSATAS
jgi:ribosome-associated translation inhibitor RaiA